MGNQGTMDLARALQNNNVNCIFLKKLYQYYLHFIFQSLVKLWLWQNQIGHEGVQYLTHLLCNNTVISIL